MDFFFFFFLQIKGEAVMNSALHSSHAIVNGKTKLDSVNSTVSKDTLIVLILETIFPTLVLFNKKKKLRICIKIARTRYNDTNKRDGQHPQVHWTWFLKLFISMQPSSTSIDIEQHIPRYYS